MENKNSFGSNIGFLLAAIGSAVGLGNIWGFPYKMGKSGGFTFLLVYLALAIFVGFIIMVSELAIGRSTGKGAIAAYQSVGGNFKWIGWLAIISPFFIMSFYSVLGGHCLQYMALNMAELSFNVQKTFGIALSGKETFSSMLTNPFGCIMFTVLFLVICYCINKSSVSEGLEKFNKFAMPALFVMLLIVIVRSLSLPGAMEGLKFMFVPGYAVKAGFIDKAPDFVTVLGTAGGQMFFSLSLAMGAMITYGSYLNKKENLKKNSIIIVIADTLVAMSAGIAVIPAAVANGIKNGIPLNEIQLSGPKLLFVTLQDVFAEMGKVGPLFGIIFYLLVLIAAISSAVSLIEAISAYFADRAEAKGKKNSRAKTVVYICLAILAEAVLVAACGMGANNIAPANLLKWTDTGMYAMWNDCWLDFMDFLSEGILMPVGAMFMALMIGWEKGSDRILTEVSSGAGVSGAFKTFYEICIKVIVPVTMCFVFAGMLIDNLTPVNGSYSVSAYCYGFSALVLVIGFVVALLGKKKARQ